MTVRRFGSLLTTLVWVVAAVGCGDDKTSPPAKTEKVCDPGTVFSCYRRGCNGHQSCNSQGTEMSACTCDPPNTAGSGGRGDDGDAGAAVDAGEPLDASDMPIDAGPPPAEVCDNNEDDDGNGETDCADDACDSRSCERAAATGWKGPIELRSSDSAPPDCGGEFDTKSFEAGASPSAAAASCSVCSCTPPNAACAAFVDFTTGTEAGCGGTTCTTSVNQSCSEIMPPCLTGLTSAYLGTKLPTGTSGCAPSAQSSDKPDVTWAKRVVGCSAGDSARGGCKSGEQCLPKHASSNAICVWRDGEHDCPSQAYTQKRSYYRDVEDTRSCTACACSGPNCSYSWSVFNAADTTCASPIVALTSADQCVQVNPSLDKLRVGASITGDGSCTPSGGATQGAVSGSDEITVCCVP
jgi:hypothetical protein